MAYFSNGSEGCDYESKWCDQCVHQDGCTVWFAHLLYAYAATGEAKDILDLLIPMEPVKMPSGGTVDFAGKCKMFIEAKGKE